MFDATSRYARLEPATLTTSDGREIAYVPRRFLPRGSGLQLMQEVALADGDRLDLIAARTLGDPLQFWRICDANDALNPFDLEPGAGRADRRLRVPVPQVVS